MNVSLTPQLEEMIRAKVENGLYHSASEVVREGLRLLDERDRVRAIRMDELRARIRVGIDQADAGDTTELDPESLISKAKTIRSQRTKKESA